VIMPGPFPGGGKASIRGKKKPRICKRQAFSGISPKLSNFRDPGGKYFFIFWENALFREKSFIAYGENLYATLKGGFI
jgi:hypothetical protein